MSKKIYLMLSLVLLLMTMLCSVVAAEGETLTSGYYRYVLLEDGTAEITGFTNENATTADIPSELDGHVVSRIGDGTFLNYKSLTAITLPDSVTSIGDFAFQFCENLTTITIPDSVTSIGTNPFVKCDNISFDVSTDHPSLAVIDGVLFTEADKRLVCYPPSKTNDSYIIPDGVQMIGNHAFWFCENLTAITIPDSVTFIGEEAFTGCEGLTTIMISDSVTSIGSWAFADCRNLMTITIPDSVTFIGEEAFGNCGNDFTATVTQGGYAEQYCKDHNIPYTHSDALD